MITSTQTMLEIDFLTKKQCTALRRTLHDAYQIIAQEANDIMNMRHDVSEVQVEQRRRKMLQPNKPTGQPLTTSWLGHGQDGKKKCTDNTRLSFLEDDDTDNAEQTRVPPKNHRLREEPS